MGATIPVLFKLTDYDGNLVTTAVAKLYVAPVVDGKVGKEVLATSMGKSNVNNLFRYDPVENQYKYNLDTKGWQPGTYQLRVQYDDGTSQTTQLIIKK